MIKKFINRQHRVSVIASKRPPFARYQNLYFSNASTAGTAQSQHTSSVDFEEMQRFSKVAQEWWNPTGPYALLQKMNPLRVSYIRDTLVQFNNTNAKTASMSAFPFDGLELLDLGCGGGFLSHSLARLGANVTAVDANKDTIDVARSYNGPGTSPATISNITFVNSTAEDLVNQGHAFDSICALEILEHVNDPQDFINSCFKLVKPGGLVFFSTINRTPISYLATIALAEHILKWVPPGTHQHEKYITPTELEGFVLNAGGLVLDTTGMVYNPLLDKWILASGKGCVDLAMNYIVTARKPLA